MAGEHEQAVGVASFDEETGRRTLQRLNHHIAPDGATRGRDPRGKGLPERLEPARGVAQDGGSVVDSRPEPGQGDFLRGGSELAHEERAPDLLV